MTISFSQLNSMCKALGEFADARGNVFFDNNDYNDNNPPPLVIKDIILTVKKIDGHEVLQTMRVSDLKWFERVVRWFGFGGSTLTAVAKYLKDYEPYLPKHFSLFNEFLPDHYTEPAIQELSKLDKSELKKMRMQVIRGCEVFKRCLVHHNANHSIPVYVLLQEYGKRELDNCKPMGGSNLNLIYKMPIIDTAHFTYLKPFFRTPDAVSTVVKAYCYEHGFGVERDTDAAVENYKIAAENDDYSACYNLGCLTKDRSYLKRAKNIIQDKIVALQSFSNRLRARDPKDETPEETEYRLNGATYVETKNEPAIRKLSKDLRKVNEALKPNELIRNPKVEELD